MKRGKKAGRPSKLNTISLKQVEKLAGYNLTEPQIADILEICQASITNYKHNPKFLAALKRGKAKSDNYVIGSLFHRAIGYTHPEVQLFCYKGKIVKAQVLKHYPPDPTSMIFWLKNRQPKEWRDRQELEHSGERQVIIIGFPGFNGKKKSGDNGNGRKNLHQRIYPSAETTPVPEGQAEI